MPVVINFGSVFLSFLSRVLLARMIGSASFGLFAIWLNNIQLFGTAGTFGQQNFVLRELALAPHPQSEDARKTAFAAVKLSLAAGTISGVAGAVFFYWFQGGPLPAAAMQAFGAAMFAVLLTLSSVHRGLGSMATGLVFDRILYQLLFILLLVIPGGVGTMKLHAFEGFTTVLIIAASCSFGFLLTELGTHIRSASLHHEVWAQARRVVPFFVVNCLFVVNARYLLSYCGVFLQGPVLGEIGLVFSVISIMIIPTSTLNLIAAPMLARRLSKSRSPRIVLLYLSSVAILSSAGVALVFSAHWVIFRLAKIPETMSDGFVLLLCSAFGLTLISNAGLIVEQLRGRAAQAARLFSVTMVAKLIGGYWIADQYGIMALLWADIIIGGLFLIVLTGGLLKAPRPIG